MFNKYIVLFFTIAVFCGCTTDFEEINTNQNDPVDVDAGYLMSSVIVNTTYKLTKENVEGVMGVPSRYVTRVIHNADDTFKWDAEDWGYAFSFLADNEDLLQKAREKEDPHLEAIALIIKGYLFGILTDTYGDIPFEDAFGAGEENFTPVYSRQESIYTEVLNFFEQANELLTRKGNLSFYADYDPMFSGDILAWRKLANSMHIRYLLRIASKKPEAYTTLQSMLNDPETYPLILSNEDNALIPYLGNKKSDASPLGSYDNDFYDRRPSKVFVDYLLDRNDPRLPVWVREVADPKAGTVDNNAYVGLPIALHGATNYNGTTNHTDYESSNYSEFGTIFHEDSNPLFNAVIFQASEMYFILAELLQEHGITYPGETAESLYLKGIKTSMEQYAVADQAEVQNYYDQELVAYNGSLEQIIAQKWVSLLFVAGSETWFDHRRTGFPVFPFGPLSIREEIPYRMPYPSEEASYNAENYEKAINDQGWSADDNYEKIWLLR